MTRTTYNKIFELTNGREFKVDLYSDDIFPQIMRSRFPVSEWLFHYTGSEGLKGIFETHEIWATHHDFLNDNSEGRRAFDATLTHLLNMPRPEDPHEQNLREMAMRGVHELNDASIYVVSFSTEGNLLSQWRSYTPQGGYSIGFRLEDLLKTKQRFAEGPLPCVYGDDMFADVEHKVERYFEVFRTVRPDLEGEDLDLFIIKWADFFVRNVLIYGACCKHEAFKEETECRMIFSSSASFDCNYRTCGPLVVPYFRIPLVDENDEMLKPLIYVGPQPNADIAERGVRHYLDNIEQPNYGILQSKIPYRFM